MTQLPVLAEAVPGYRFQCIKNVNMGYTVENRAGIQIDEIRSLQSKVGG
jgi:hypothetical protein